MSMTLTTIAVAVILYVLVIFLLYKFIEKFFKVLFFIITALFVIGLLYLMSKGF